MWTVEEAWQAICQYSCNCGLEQIPLNRAHGRHLAETLVADRDFPPFDRVAMDGIAIRFADWQKGTHRFQNSGCQAAGAPRMTLVDTPGLCLEVMTGAILPSGCDTVIPVEQTRSKNGMIDLEPGLQLQQGRHIHRRATDLKAGTPLLTSGKLLRAPEIAVAATVGAATMKVYKQPTISVLSTGDELVEITEMPLDHQIRQSNGPSLWAALQRAGFAQSTHQHLPDDRAILAAGLEKALEHSDVLILSGGVSMGKFDLVPGVLEEQGVNCVFHKVRQRPGKPLWFGRRSDGKTVFGLPGNPVSAVVCLHRYVLPWLLAGPGTQKTSPESLPLSQAITFRPDLSWFLPVSLETDSTGRRMAVPRQTGGSGDLASLCDSDGFVELPRGQQDYPEGFLATFYPWV